MSDKLNLDFLFNSIYIFSLSRYLVVLDETNVVSTLTEALSLHVDTVLADKSHTSLTSGNSALTASLSVSTGVSVIKLVRNTCLGHFYITKKRREKVSISFENNGSQSVFFVCMEYRYLNNFQR